MKQYTLFTGVNGAGKTSLYYAAFENNDLVDKRINIDEIVHQSGSWKDTRLQIEAGKSAIALIQQYINESVSFHQETTLSGRLIFRTVLQAKEQGLRIALNYLGVCYPSISAAMVDDIEKNFYNSAVQGKELEGKILALSKENPELFEEFIRLFLQMKDTD